MNTTSNNISGAAPATVAPQGVVAWMTPEGDRVVTAETMDGARKDGGASLSSLRPYTVALVRGAVAPALEAPAAPAGDEEAAFKKWFQGEQGKPYQGMWEFARAAWMARAATAAAPQAPAAPSDPMDWPLPCDVTVGHITIRKGCKLRSLVLRMQVLYDLSRKVELAAPAAPAVDASPLLAPETELDAVVRDAEQIIRDAEHYRFIKRHRLILSGGTDTFGWPIAPFGDECDRYIAQELATERAAQAKEGGAA